MIDRRILLRIGRVVALVVFAVAIGLGVRLYLTRDSGPQVSVVGGIAAIGGPFTLVDQDGKTRSDADFRGKLMLVYFGYTFCPDACPTALLAMTQALEALGEKAAKVTPIFVTIDPARDTSAVMKDYVSHFDPRFVALTGTPAQIAAAAHAYRVYYAKAPNKDAPNDYLMDHTGFIYLMGTDGRYLTHFTPDATPKEMAAKIAKFL